MDSLTEKVAYLKGLAEGLDLGNDTKEAKKDMAMCLSIMLNSNSMMQNSINGNVLELHLL